LKGRYFFRSTSTNTVFAVDIGTHTQCAAERHGEDRQSPFSFNLCCLCKISINVFDGYETFTVILILPHSYHELVTSVIRSTVVRILSSSVQNRGSLIDMARDRHRTDERLLLPAVLVKVVSRLDKQYWKDALANKRHNILFHHIVDDYPCRAE
jgi:hypothetical protein